MPATMTAPYRPRQRVPKSINRFGHAISSPFTANKQRLPLSHCGNRCLFARSFVRGRLSLAAIVHAAHARKGATG
jgi:hypothetical protein